MSTPAEPTLLALPAELRNRIYSHLLADPAQEPFHISKECMEPPILSVNRQLRDECRAFFYANNTLHFSDPEVCLRRLTTLPTNHLDLISEVRYDTSEICTTASSWRTAFRELPGLDQDTKLDNLRDELAKKGIVLKVGVLKARVVINCEALWTCDPLGAALDAVRQGRMVGRMMFV